MPTGAETLTGVPDTSGYLNQRLDSAPASNLMGMQLESTYQTEPDFFSEETWEGIKAQFTISNSLFSEDREVQLGQDFDEDDSWTLLNDVDHRTELSLQYTESEFEFLAEAKSEEEYQYKLEVIKEDRELTERVANLGTGTALLSGIVAGMTTPADLIIGIASGGLSQYASAARATHRAAKVYQSLGRAAPVLTAGALGSVEGAVSDYIRYEDTSLEYDMALSMLYGGIGAGAIAGITRAISGAIKGLSRAEVGQRGWVDPERPVEAPRAPDDMDAPISSSSRDTPDSTPPVGVREAGEVELRVDEVTGSPQKPLEAPDSITRYPSTPKTPEQPSMALSGAPVALTPSQISLGVRIADGVPVPPKNFNDMPASQQAAIMEAMMDANAQVATLARAELDDLAQYKKTITKEMQGLDCPLPSLSDPVPAPVLDTSLL